MTLKQTLVLICLSLINLPAGYAANSSTLAFSQQHGPMHITADKANFNSQTGRGEFDGHVKLDQTGSHILANKLIIFVNKQHQLQKAIATGNLVHFTRDASKDKPKLTASAREMRYLPLQAQVILRQQATITQQGDTMHGEHIIYDLKRDVVQSLGTKQQSTLLILQQTQKG